MKAEIVKLKQELKTRNKALVSLKRKNRLVTSKKYQNSLIREASLKRFSLAKTNFFLHNNRRAQRWSQQDIIDGLVLRSFSRKAYRYLRKKNLLPLPCETTLKTWIRNFKCSPGLQSDLLCVLSSKLSGNLPSDYRDCILSFDEMSIKQCYEYSHQEEKVYGPCKKLQIGILRGVFHKWKLPIFFDFDTPMTENLLLQIISEAEKHHARVRGVAADLGNHKLMSELELTPAISFMTHPCDPSRKVFFFPDIPHLLKLLRNHLLDQGFVWPDGTSIQKSDLELLLSLDNSEIKILPKITKEHLDCQQNARQRVRMAAQLLSHSTATAMKILLPEKTQQADFIELVDSWFDVSNSRCMFSAKKLSCGFGIHLDDQQNVLDRMEKCISDMRVKGRKSLLPFQKGILLSISSIRGLFQEILSEGKRCLLTAHCNSDPAENFFSCIRTMGVCNDHPGPVDCLNRIRLLVVSRDAQIVVENSSVEVEPPSQSEPEINLCSSLFNQTFSNKVEVQQ